MDNLSDTNSCDNNNRNNLRDDRKMSGDTSQQSVDGQVSNMGLVDPNSHNHSNDESTNNPNDNNKNNTNNVDNERKPVGRRSIWSAFEDSSDDSDDEQRNNQRQAEWDEEDRRYAPRSPRNSASPSNSSSSTGGSRLPRGESIFLVCPNCEALVEVRPHEIRCGVFRHAVFKRSMRPIPPHASQEECERWLSQDEVYGCARPFRVVRDSAESSGFKAVPCDYI